MKKFSILYKGTSTLLIAAALFTGCSQKNTLKTPDMKQSTTKISNTSFIQGEVQKISSTQNITTGNASYEVSGEQDDAFYKQRFLTQMTDLNTGDSLADTIYIPLAEDKAKEGSFKLSFVQREDNVASFSWEAVEGAAEYCIYRKENLTGTSLQGTSNIIGRTTNTSWSSGWSSNMENSFINSDFACFDVSEAELEEESMQKLYSDKYDTKNGPIRISDSTYSFGVVAIFPDGSFLDADTLFPESELCSNLPMRIIEDDNFPNYANSIEDLSQTRRITMCDGKTVEKKVIYDMEHAKKTDETFVSNASADGADATWNSENVSEVPYSIEGTPFTGVVYLSNATSK